jgi:S-adenosylmethionine-diacylglycerol 3-amino-3-carboxypropyl transferase
MKAIFDFGISQEDYQTEQAVLDIHSGDRLLSIASGGEVPLNLLCSNTDIQILAVDISSSQIQLCKLKMQAAIQLQYPMNGLFLGYGKMKKSQRKELFKKRILPHLREEEKVFWSRHAKAIEEGVVNSGRFERYISKWRWLAKLLLGSRNIKGLIKCQCLEEQQALFNKKIKNRKGVRLLFKIAFHPLVYRKRGLDAKGLQHASEDTGERYFKRFQNFCTATSASTNHFLQYFLLGACQTQDAFPAYLQEKNRRLLAERSQMICFRQCSFTEAIRDSEKGEFNKFHLSNIGDWLSVSEFNLLWHDLKKKLPDGAKLCHRFLQRNHFADVNESGVVIEECAFLQEKDRFPFYSTLSIAWHA